MVVLVAGAMMLHDHSCQMPRARTRLILPDMRIPQSLGGMTYWHGVELSGGFMGLGEGYRRSLGHSSVTWLN